jgi:periplasmic divalent cation tolerance protein
MEKHNQSALDTGVLIVLSTIDKESVAKELAQGMVQKKLAACVNILSACTSIYRWKGKIQEESEYLMVIKTKKENYSQVEKYLKESHPYDVPEIIGWEVTQGSADYLNWLKAEVQMNLG